jgi:hypothetical protein
VEESNYKLKITEISLGIILDKLETGDKIFRIIFTLHEPVKVLGDGICGVG